MPSLEGPEEPLEPNIVWIYVTGHEPHKRLYTLLAIMLTSAVLRSFPPCPRDGHSQATTAAHNVPCTSAAPAEASSTAPKTPSEGKGLPGKNHRDGGKTAKKPRITCAAAARPQGASRCAAHLRWQPSGRSMPYMIHTQGPGNAGGVMQLRRQLQCRGMSQTASWTGT